MKLRNNCKDDAKITYPQQYQIKALSDQDLDINV